MAHAVHISRRALREIDESLTWRAEHFPGTAGRWHAQLLKAVQSLEHNPERCPLAPENEWFPGPIRQLLVGKKHGTFRILFELRGSVVYILRARHNSQNLLGPGEL